MAAILDFQLEQYWLFVIFKSPQSFLPSFKSIGLSFQKSKIDFQDGDSYFCFTSHPDASYQVSSQLAFQFRRRSEK